MLQNMDSAQPSKFLGLVCGFCLHALLRLYHLLRFGIPKAARRLTALLFNRIFYYSYLILRRLAGRRKNFTFNSQLLTGTGFINCKMSFQSGNLSGRNNTTGLDTFQPPLSLDGGPDVLLDYFSLYAAFSFALQRPDAFTSSQISQSFTIVSTAESKNMEAKIIFCITRFNALSTSEKNHSNVCMSLFNFGVGTKKVLELARIFLKCVLNFQVFVFENLHVCTTTS